ncbi:MAG: hypothetical protein ABIQ30_15715 [Devosia sp.]
MPTLIRLFIVLLVLGGIGFAGMIALTVMVDPGEKDVTIKIPARELTVPADNEIIDVNNLPAPVNVAPKEESSEPSAISSEEKDSSGVKTVDIPAPE